MTAPDNFRAALAEADTIHHADDIDRAVATMASAIDRDYVGHERPLFLTVMNGGLFFAARLALAARTDFEFDYVHATRYRGVDGGELNWIKRPEIVLAARHVLLVDDILDEGYTLLAVRDYCRTQGATSVRIAVLTHKEHGRRAPGIVADYAGLAVPDRYVFGYGMDWHGHGRNLPAIHALREST